MMLCLIIYGLFYPGVKQFKDRHNSCPLLELFKKVGGFKYTCTKLIGKWFDSYDGYKLMFWYRYGHFFNIDIFSDIYNYYIGPWQSASG